MKQIWCTAALAISIVVCSAVPGFTIPAPPITHRLSQPDGTVFSGRQWGDEWRHGWETDRGYSIIRDSLTGFWQYAVRSADGRLVASGTAVGRGAPPAGIARRLRPRADTVRRGRVAARDLGPNTALLSGGEGRLPVLLVNFRDTVPTYGVDEFERRLFSSDNGSMKSYYDEVSYGNFTVSGGSGGVVDWYTARRRHDYYGRNDFYDFDVRTPELVREAVAAADKTVDFSEYDLDGDCYCDVVAIVHQGIGEEWGYDGYDIWSHSWSLSDAQAWGYGRGEYVTDDTAACGSIKVDSYIIQPETSDAGIGTIGVFAHEYAHALGLPDLYDVDYSSIGIGDWGLMASGSWNYVTDYGDSPAHMCAWSKYALGWAQPAMVTGMRVDETIEPAAVAPDIYQLQSGSPVDGGEYFLVENRQQIGFDAGLPGHGLAIWHVDELLGYAFLQNTSNSYECYYPDTCAYVHYQVGLEQADGQWDLEKYISPGDAGDLFPGATGNRAYTDNATPNSRLYGELRSNISITDISEEGDNVIATLGYLVPHDIVIGLGAATYGWFDVQDTYKGSGPVTHRAWAASSLDDYNEQNGETRIAAGDIDGDGKDELVVGLGPVPGSAMVPGGMFEVLDDDYRLLASGTVEQPAYNSANGETWPALGDVDGDGFAEIIIGLGAYSVDGGLVEVFDYDNATLQHKAWISAGTAQYNAANGETRPSCGDVDGDGLAEIIVGFGRGAQGRMEIYDDTDGAYGQLAAGAVDFAAYNAANGETRPSCGDVDGDGRDEIIAGLGSYTADGGRLAVLEYADGGISHKAWQHIDWDDYNAANGESRPVCADIDGDGRDETAVGLGRDGDGRVAFIDDAAAGYAHMLWAEVDSPIYRSSGGETRPAIKDVIAGAAGDETALLELELTPSSVAAETERTGFRQYESVWRFTATLSETAGIPVRVHLLTIDVYDNDGERVDFSLIDYDTVGYYFFDILPENYLEAESSLAGDFYYGATNFGGGTYALTAYGVDDYGNKVQAASTVVLEGP